MDISPCKKLKFIFLILFFTQLTYGQLSDFTLTVTPTHETCTANGALSFAVSNTVSGSTMVYSIYKLPNITTPIAVVSASVYTGLTAGNYLVIATQSLGAQSGTQEQQVTILNQTAVLTYQISSSAEVCGNDGVIAIHTLTGQASTYEIIAGPMTRPLQPSNTFTGLTAGQYTIRVFDICAEGVVQTYTLIHKNPALNLTNNGPSLSGCNSVSIGFSFTPQVAAPGGTVQFPLQVTTTINPPVGSPIVTTNTITGGNSFAMSTALLTPQPYTYSFTVTDGCGATYSLTGTINNMSTSVSSAVISVTCTTKKIKFTDVTGLILTSAPAGYPNPLPQNFTSQIVGNEFTTLPLGVGTYVFQATNLCGQTQTLTYTIIAETLNAPYAFPYAVTCNMGSLAFYYITQIVLIAAPAAYTGPLPYDFSSTINASNIAVLEHLPAGTYTFNVVDTCGTPTTITGTINPTSMASTYSVYPTCADNNTNTLKIQGQLDTIILTVAPASYTGTLPQNFTAQVLSGSLILNNLPLGTYTFMITNACNITNPLTVVLPAQVETTTVDVTQNCGSFNLQLHHTTNSSAASTFWLQKYYPADDDWGHPGSGVLQGSNLPSGANAVSVTNNILMLNLPYSGQFRIVKVQTVHVPGSIVPGYCFKTIHEFETNGQPVITGLTSVSCNNTFDVIVNATGFGPLTYRITTKNGLPFVINNGNSNLFTGLVSAIYNFQVTDFCGNIVNSVFEINVQNPLVIVPANLCPNEAGSLSVTYFGFLTYQWWNNNNPSVILSTTNALNFANFTAASAGTYSVRISYLGNPNSCLNTTLVHTISADGFSPNAGNGTAVSYCGDQGVINVFSLLQGYDTGGSWEVVTNNAVLSGSDWNSANASAGLYQFKYTVEGICDITDDATVSITIKDIPGNPVPSVDPIICDSQDIALFATSIPNATYQWTGPNNFTSTNQNPIIENATPANSGIYSVKAIKAGCISETTTVTVAITPLPQFTLEAKCEGNRFVISAIPENDSFDVDSVSYSWSGPNGYNSSVNPIDITQLPSGDYSLTVTDANGCDSTEVVPVTYTFCEIPNVITPNGDSSNNSFNLSGLDVKRLEIYNRWGRKVYEKENYLNEWYGQNMHGGSLPDSTYYYYIKLGNDETKVGWVFVNKG